MSAEAQRRYKARHPDRIRETDRRYSQSEGGRAVRRRALAAWKLRNPEIVAFTKRAHLAVRNELRAGRMVRQPCEVCGSGRFVQAHHPNGYEPDHWLDIVWLCLDHHREEHGWPVRCLHCGATETIELHDDRHLDQSITVCANCGSDE